MGAIESNMLDAPLCDAAALVWSAIATAFRPSPRIMVSEWADQHRRLPSKSSAEAGRWRTSRVPQLREVMDCLSPRHPAQRVVFMKPVQIGGTEAGLNWIGSLIQTQRDPIMIVQPTLQLAEIFSKQKLSPMIEEAPALRKLVRPARERDSGNTTLIKEFPGGILMLTGANSAAGFRQVSICYLMLDDLDGYPHHVEQEGDPQSLAEGRVSAYPHRHKIYLVSTPTIESLSRINREWLASDQRHYYVACPHCHAMQTLEWEFLTWEKGKPEIAAYACIECGALIEEYHKTEMLEAGEWRATYPARAVVGFHINALYTPLGLGFGWAKLATEFEAAQNDPQKLKTFENVRLARVTRDPTEKLDWEELSERAEARALRAIPRGCLLLTAGIDVQKDRWAVIILGWGRQGLIWVIDYFELPGDPTQANDWLQLEKRVKEPLVNGYRIAMRVELAGVDSGYLQDDVVHFTRPRQRRGWFAVKGAKNQGLPIITRPSRIDYSWRGQLIKGGAQQWQIGVFNAKEWLFARLATDRERLPEDRLIRFCAGLGESFYGQLTAEVFDSTRKRFVKIRERNEALDTFCYALAAGMHPLLRAHTWQEPKWAQREVLLEPVTADLFSEVTEAAEMPPQLVTPETAAPALSIEEMIRRAKANSVKRPS